MTGPFSEFLRRKGGDPLRADVIRYKEDDSVSNSTGSRCLDWVLSGGIPEGRVVDITSRPGNGKTSFCLALALQYLREGKKVCYVAGDFDFGDLIGRPDVKPLMEFGENFIFTTLTDFKELEVWVAKNFFLSDAAILFMDDLRVGLQTARIYSHFIEIWTKKLAVEKSSKSIVFATQQRRRRNSTTAWDCMGPKCLGFYSSIRLELQIEREYSSDGVLRFSVEAIKNKVGVPFRKIGVDLNLGVGFVDLPDILENLKKFEAMPESDGIVTDMDGQPLPGFLESKIKKPPKEDLDD